MEEEASKKRKRRTGWDAEDDRPSASGGPNGSTLPASAPVVPANVDDHNLALLNAQIVAQQVIARVGGISIQQQPLLQQQSNPLQNLQQQHLQLLQQQQQLQQSQFARRIYVGSLQYDLQDTDIFALFSAFGTVSKVDMTKDHITGKSKGFCFVEFAEIASAQAAMTMDGFELAGRKIKIGKPCAPGSGTMGMPPVGPSFPLPLGLCASVPPFPAPQNFLIPTSAPQISQGPSPFPGLPPRSAGAALPLTMPGPPPPTKPFVIVRNIRSNIEISSVQELFSLHGAIKSIKRLNSQSLDPELYYDALLEYVDAEKALLAEQSMNGHVLARTALAVEAISLSKAVELMMQKVESAATAAGAPPAIPRRTVLLLDMVSAADLDDPDLEEEIADEARNYGSLQEVVIHQSTDQPVPVVSVFLTYEEPGHASRACNTLNGRMFAGKKIRASLVPRDAVPAVARDNKKPKQSN